MMAYLLDVNVLLALSWPSHQFHSTVQRWFAQHAQKGWATCPVTEMGFVRILSNPSFSSRAVSPTEAIAALAVNVKHPAHRFWPDDLSVTDGLTSTREQIFGHQQVTDFYLLALAMHHRGKLATLDEAFVAAVGKSSSAAHVSLVH